MSNFSILRSLLKAALLLIFPVGLCAAHQKNRAKFFHPVLEKRSNTYPHDLLDDVRAKQEALVTSSSLISLLQSRLSLSPLAIDVDWVSPWVLLNVNAFPDWNPTMEATKCVNLLIGPLHRKPWYLRLGYDFIPIGRHLSDVQAAQIVAAQFGLNQKDTLMSVGTSHTTDSHRWRHALAYAVVLQVLMYTVDYDCLLPSGYLHAYRLGSGLALGRGPHSIMLAKEMIYPIINCYFECKYRNQDHFLGEYVYCKLFDQRLRVLSPTRNDCSPHIFRTEYAKKLPILPSMKDYKPLALVLGCKYGKFDPLGKVEPVDRIGAKVFGVLKLEVTDQWFGRYFSVLYGCEWQLKTNRFAQIERITWLL